MSSEAAFFFFYKSLPVNIKRLAIDGTSVFIIPLIKSSHTNIEEQYLKRSLLQGDKLVITVNLKKIKKSEL